ncbi:MAG: shikimate dehydrogenase [Deltaproteobacteria bacterium]|nr:shikimate dehydrogenase [Deltaproteobacteria bacterium]
MKPSSSTKLIGIFGDPVSLSLSPAMQNAAFEQMGIDAVYLAFHVPARPAAVLKTAVSSIKALGFMGVNITVPHKEKVIEFLDSVDGEAVDIGAVNTIVNKAGKLTGYNTDARGYIESLRQETGFSSQGKNAVVIGAGGASRAIAFALLKAGAKRLVIANRTLRRGQTLSRALKKKFLKAEITVAPLDKKFLRSVAEDSLLIVNTTSLGMAGNEELDFPLYALPTDAVVSDIVYRPHDTGFIKKALVRGLNVHRGLGMLSHQGALAFELWTGKKAPLDIMRMAALKALKFPAKNRGEFDK